MASIPVSPPNAGPEPPGFAADVASTLFGAPAPAAPDAYALLGTDANALQLLSDTRKFCDTGREAFEWGWWRALLYFLGRQWIYWDPGTRTWNDKRLARWVPKPVTNIVRTTYDSIFALLQDVALGVNCRPNGQSPKNVITAETVDALMPLLHQEHDMDTVTMLADFWAILLGNAYLHPHWDKDNPNNVTNVPMWQCLTCQTVVPPDAVIAAGQKCPACGSMALRPAMGPNGQPITMPVKIGAGRTLALSPFELLLPLYAQSFGAVDRLVHTTWLPRHEIEALAPESSKRVNWTTAPNGRSLQLHRSLALQSDLPLTNATWSMRSAGTDTEGQTVQYLWIKAGAKYDKGVYLPFIGEGDSAIVARELIEQQQTAGAPTATTGVPGGSSRPEIPYKSATGAALWPWIHYPYKPVGGRLFAQSAVDPILQKQDQINQIDSMTQLVANRMGNPIWLEPKGAEVERFTGEPGLIVRWQPVGPSGAKPERIAGENPPQSFFALRQQFMGDAEELSGTYDVVKGAKPTGVEAFSALQLLVERSQSRFTPVFKARGRAYRDWSEIAVELERSYGPTERIANARGPNNNWTSRVFKAADLQGAITIIVEDGSNVPKTALGRRAAIEHANQLQLLAPQANPDQAYAMTQELGVSSLFPALDADVKSALQEQQAFEDWAAKGGLASGTPPPLVRLPWHNDLVHLNENRKWMNSDAVRDILAQAGPQAPMLIQALAAHLLEHQQAVLAQQMAQAQAAAPAGPGGGRPGASAGGPPPAGHDGGGVGAGRAAHSSNQQGGHHGVAPPAAPSQPAAPRG